MVERLCTLFELFEQFIGVKYLYIDSWLPRAGCAASLPFQTHTSTFRHTSYIGFDGLHSVSFHCVIPHTLMIV